MDYIIEYINPVLIPIALVLWCIGKGIKENQKIRDELIPVLLPFAGIGLVALWTCTQGIPANTGEWLVLAYNSIVQGVLTAAAAVWGDQTIKQIRKAKEG